nr:MAG TPA: hypothetical protein [Caudoviricetes sp.]
MFLHSYYLYCMIIPVWRIKMFGKIKNLIS